MRRIKSRPGAGALVIGVTCPTRLIRNVGQGYSIAYPCQRIGTHLTTPRQPWERLREERERLGLNQTEFGALGGVRKQAQIKYEKGARKPDAKYLEGIAAAGVDVGYILTGDRAALRDAYADLRTATEAAMTFVGVEDRPQHQAEAFAALRAGRASTQEETAFLADYRACGATDQQLIRQLAARLADPGEPAQSPDTKS